ncbi:MAG TPA: hypothetical protein VGF67_02515 [Ktedonobacteraceae bacterium]
MVNFVLIDDPDELKPLPSWPFVAHENRPNYPRNWSRVSWLIRRMAGNRCVWCGSSYRLRCHHMGVPYSDDPVNKSGDPCEKYDLRLANLYALCEQCEKQAERMFPCACREKRRKHRRLGVGTGLVVYEAR